MIKEMATLSRATFEISIKEIIQMVTSTEDSN